MLAKLRPKLLHGIQDSLLWKEETARKEDVTRCVATQYMTHGQGWIMLFTLSCTYGQNIENVLQSPAGSLADLFDDEYMEAMMTVRVIFSDGDMERDCQLQCAMDNTKGHNIVLSLHKLE
jgi:hypothetical protein